MKKLFKGMSQKASVVFLLGLSFSVGCGIQQVARDGYYNVKHNIQGNYYLDNKKYMEGIEAFRQELKTNPESAESHFFLGRCLLAENHPKEARHHLQQAAGLSPEKADYHFWLGVAYAANMEKTRERECYLRALELDPGHVQALTYLGHNQLESFEYVNALNTYNKVLDLSPDNPSALYNRGLVLKRLGRRSEGRLAWKQYLALYSSGPMAQLAAVNLNALGDFEYRNYFIGGFVVTLERVHFKPFTATISGRSWGCLDTLGEILEGDGKPAIHIVAYQKNNKSLAERRAKGVKRYLLDNFPEITPSRLKVSWFGVPEQIKVGKKTFIEDESINLFSAVQPQKK
jgi:tetratricopeptide (TPR) repeat protein